MSMSWEESGFISCYLSERKTNGAALLDDHETEDHLKVANDWHAYQSERSHDSL